MTTSFENLPVRALTSAVRLTRLILVIVTPLVLLLTVLVVIGVGSLRLAGSTDAVRPVQLEPGEYQIETGDGQRADVAETTVFESSDGKVTFGTTRVDISIDDDADALAIRAVAGMLVVVWLILVWVGVNSLHGISTSMRAGDRFTTENSRRVRRLGIVALAYPALAFLGRLLLRQMVDALDLAGPPVAVDVGVADWWVWVLFGLLLVAIAELFAHGVALQELDEATI
jgi:hypothetical protein